LEDRKKNANVKGAGRKSMKDDEEKMTGRQDWDTRLAVNSANGAQTINGSG